MVMKQFILFSTIAILFFSNRAFSQQQQPYQQDWEKVAQAENNGKSRTAWNITKTIYSKATRDKNNQEQIKALIYQLKYRSAIEENANLKNIHQVDSLRQKANGITQALLQNLEAKIYLAYVHANKFKILNRTTSSSESQEDISTWSLPHLYDTISHLYLHSLNNKEKLKSIPVKNYTTLIDTGKNALSLRPTLYDVLTHNALEYFTSEESTLTKPAQHFVINNPKALAPASTFVKESFETVDSSSQSWNALKLYQDLITFHLKDKNPEALVDADIHRLEFVFNKGVFPKKDTLFKKALRHLIEKYPAPLQSEATYRLAQWFYSKGNLYNAQTHPKYQWAKKAALLLCKKGSDSLVNEGTVKCNQLKERILHPNLSVKTEQVNIPKEPFRALVSYQNEDEVWFRIVPLETKPRRIFRHPAQLADLLEEEPLKTWNLDLPLPKDYQEHKVEIKVDPLPVGRYALIASTNSNFNKEKSPVSYIKFSVSNLSYVEDREGNFLVLDRESGKPIKKAKVRIWHTKYSKKKKKNVLDKGNRYKTDKQGHFQLDKDEKGGRFLLEVSKKKEHLFVVQQSYHSHSIPKITKKKEIKGFLFTDRSIYRPGQKLYFKGLLTQTNQTTEDYQVIQDKTVTVFLYDANNQKIDSQKVTSNNFGSFSGTFDLPASSMNGRMHLSVTRPGIYHAFSVEAYKRPTFDLHWDKKAKNYKLGDQVTVSGKVMGYNGVPENGANIKYQVSRKPFRFPYRHINTSRMIYPPSYNQKQIITQGVIKADAVGQFKIPFKAIPKEGIPKKYRIFNYKVSIDVSNTSGESHHYDYNLPIGDHSLLLSLEMPKKIELKNTDTIFVKSTDLQGKFKPTSVAITIYPLKGPQRFIKKRLWDSPDQFIMDEKDFLDNFPHDEYKEESKKENWTKGAPVYVSNDRTNAKGKIPFNPGNIRQGWYLIEVTTRDKSGEYIKDSQYVQIYHSGVKHIPFFHKMIWTSKDNLSGVPGDKLSWKIGSSEKAFIFEQNSTLKGTEKVQKLRLNHKVKDENYKVTDADRGGLVKHYVSVRFNRVFKKDLTIKVPWKEKQLQIKYQTFRNKILPGKKEKWEVQITGPNHEKVNAELLAAMYDLSLDQFTPHHWDNLHQLFPKLQNRNAWDYDQNFRVDQSNNAFVYHPKRRKHPDFHRQYPTLRSFGLYKSHFPISFRGQSLNERVIVGFRKDSKKQTTGAISRRQNLSQQKAPMAPEGNVSQEKNNPVEETTSPKAPLKIRKDFRETAFFYPHLHTDAEGNISFSFTSPEALTQWKLMLQAHTKDLEIGYSEKTVTTQKPLMIQMNAPRFVRQGDQLTLTAKVSNLSKKPQSGKALLSFKNTETNKESAIIEKNKEVSFSVKPGQTTSVSWKIDIPKDYTDALTYTVNATAGSFSDGEQDILPVLSNQTEITSSLPFHFTGNGHHQINWETFSKLGKSSSIQPENITVEYTANPIWYVVQALPFIDKDYKKCANALFRKVYANALSRYVALKIPHFKEITQHWLQADSNALKSPLQKNEELKNILLKETPWVRTAQSEAAQKARVAHWYQQTDEQLKLKAAIEELKKLQLGNGGFSWFKKMPDNWLITQEIVTGIGHLKKLHAFPHIAANDLRNIVRKAVPYLDKKMKERYQWLQSNNQLEKTAIRPIDIQYLYMRSFFPDIPMEKSINTGYQYFYQQAEKHWTKQSPYLKSMLALTFNKKKKALAQKIVTSLEETLIKGNHGGLHWKKRVSPVYYWHQAPIATQAIALEAFTDLGANQDTINAMREWLLNQKQTRFWGTQRATANAVYALLLDGSDWEQSKPKIHIQIGDSTYVFGNGKWGLQYKKITIPKEDINPKMQKLQVDISGAADNQPGWGAAYFQYFANMNKVAGEGSELHIQRKVSKEENTAGGQTLTPIDQNTQLKVGDKVKIRLIVKAERDMDFVHFKDIRATCMEPLQVISGYRFKDGVGYYSTVDDAAVHFYFRHLPKGTYVFNYTVYITQKGDFTGGLSQIESLYAPEIRGHSEGVRLQVQ